MSAMGPTKARWLISVLAAAVLAGCSGNDELAGDAEPPAGYRSFDDLGVSFAYPEGWERSLEVERESSTTVRLTSPQGGPFVNVQRIEDPPSFEALLEERSALRENDPDVDTEETEEVDVPGAQDARRTVVELSEPGGATGRTVTLAVLTGTGEAIFLTAAADERSGGLDPEAVIDSFRLAEG